MVATLVLAGFLAAQPVSFLVHAEIDGPDVHLADVADLRVLPLSLRSRAAGIVVGRAANDGSVLSSRHVAARARAALPALSPWMTGGAGTFIHLVMRSTASTDGARVRPITAAPAPRFSPGDPVTVSIQVGPVTIAREARALQPGWAGRSVFVRTDDGHVLTAAISAD